MKRNEDAQSSIQVWAVPQIMPVAGTCLLYQSCRVGVKKRGQHPIFTRVVLLHHQVAEIHGNMQDGEGEPEDIAEAMRSIQFSPSKPSAARHTPGHPLSSQPSAYHANSRARAPSQSSQRRNSFDERRIPPTLHEDALQDQRTDDAAAAFSPAHPVASSTRSRSGTASSHRLLRRISSETVQSLDFDSDVRI